MKSILIVDDNLSFLKSIGRSVQSLGRVFTAAGGLEVRTNFLDHPWDLILLDYDLVDCVAYDLTASLKANSPNAPIFLVSGVVDKQIAIEGFKHPINGIFEKPFELNSLVEGRFPHLFVRGLLESSCVKLLT